MNLDFPQGRTVAAGEYVMGTLKADERLAFEAALPKDRELLAEAYRWQDRLLSLAWRVMPIEPEAGGWDAIQARITRRALAAAEPGRSDEVARAQAQVPNPAPAPAPTSAPDTQALRLWKTISALAVVACLVLATLLLMQAPAPPGPVPERFLSLLQAADKSTGWLVEVTVGQRLRLLPLGAAEALPAGKVLHLWARADAANGATALGRVDPGQVSELPPHRLPGPLAQLVFELTLEPESAAPTDRPTGPVLYSGRSLRL